MPTDATGTPTSLGIPTFNVDADAPSGLGFNAAMAEINALIGARLLVDGTPTDTQMLVYNSTSGTWQPGDAPAGVTLPTFNTQTASYTAVLADANNWVVMNDASANNFTIPSGVFAVGDSLTVMQKGAGQTTIVAGSGVTFDNTPGLKIAAQKGLATAVCIATDEWAVFGNLTA